MNHFAKILLVDDDVDQHVIVKSALPALTELDCVCSSEEAVKILKKNHFEIVIVDLNLNGESGFQLLENLNKQEIASESIKVMLTASEDEEDEVAGHKFGISEFVKKPLRPKVFAAIIVKLLKSQVHSNIWLKGGLRINISKMLVEGKLEDGEFTNISLTPKEFKLLIKLIKHPEQIFSREQIFEDIWQGEDESYLRSIDTHISMLRKKISAYKVKLTSVRGIGYKIKVE